MMRPMVSSFLLVVGVAALVIAPAAHAQVVQNGDFEGVNIAPSFLSSSAASVPGWTHFGTAGDALIWRVGYSDGSGNITTAGSNQQFVTMGGGFGGSGTAGWTTNVTSLLVGQTYSVDFLMASETASLSQSLTVDFTAGSSTGAQIFSAAASSANYWRGWEAKSMSFTATATTTTVRFSSTTSQDVGLDNVRVSAVVPEASPLSLLAVGSLLCVGVIVRRGDTKRRGATA